MPALSPTAPAASRGETPRFRPEKLIVLAWREPVQFVRARRRAGLAALTRRERFLMKFMFSIGAGLGWLGWLWMLPEQALDPRLWPGLFCVIVLSPLMIDFCWFRAPLRWPDTRVRIERRGLVYSGYGLPFSSVRAFDFVERDGQHILRLTLHRGGAREIALPDETWRAPVAAAFEHFRVAHHR